MWFASHSRKRDWGERLGRQLEEGGIIKGSQEEAVGRSSRAVRDSGSISRDDVHGARPGARLYLDIEDWSGKDGATVPDEQGHLDGS